MSPEEALEKDVVSQKAISSYEIERSLLTDAYFQLKTTTTKIEKSEKALLQKDRMLSMLSSINQALVYSKDETSLLNDACRIVVEIGGYRMAWVGFAEHNEEKNILSVAYVGFESGYLESLKLTWADTERGRGPTGTAIRTGKLDIAHDIATDPKMIPWREDALKRGYLSSIALPLRIGDETFGALTIYTDNKIDAFNSDEVKMLEELATDLAFGITARRTDIERKRVEIEREQFFKFFNISTDIMVIADPNGNFKKVNPTCLRVLGYSESELISKPFIDFVLQDDKQSTLDEMARQIKSGSSLNFENRYVCKDGRVMRLSWRANYDKIEGITYATARDITEREEMEEKLRRSEEELTEAQRIGKIGNWSWDIATDTINWSKEYYYIIGFDPSQKPPNYEEHLKAYTPESAARLDAAVKKNAETGEPYELDLEFANPKVTATRWITARSESVLDEKGKVIGLRGTAQDITDRKAAEMELVKKNRMLRMLSNVNQELIHAADETSLIDDISRIIVDMGGYHMLWIGFAEQDEAKTVRPVAQTGFGNEYLTSAKISWADNERGRGPTGTAIRTGTTQIARDILKDPEMTPWREAAVKRGYKSSIALPISSDGKPFGALNIYATETDAFNEDEVAILEEISKDLAFGITALRVNIEHKALEEELLKASADRYKTLFISSRDAIMTLEPPEWKFTSGNPATIKMFGVKDEGDFLVHEPWSLSPELQLDGRNSKEKAKEMIEQAMREGSNLFEWTHRRINGEDFPAEVLLSRVDEDGNTYLHALVRDITERKRLEERVKEYAEERFKVIFENTNDGIVLADQENMKFVLGNSAICRMLGYTLEEFTKLAVADIHPKESLPYVLEQFGKQARGELKVAKNLPVKRKDGSIFYVDINTSTVTIEGKKYNLGVFRDITERKDAEKKEKEYLEGVENMNKMMVGRELKMIELKEEIETLKRELQPQ